MLNDDALAAKKFKAMAAFVVFKSQSDSLVKIVFEEPQLLKAF
jgi:cullin-4